MTKSRICREKKKGRYREEFLTKINITHYKDYRDYRIDFQAKGNQLGFFLFFFIFLLMYFFITLAGLVIKMLVTVPPSKKFVFQNDYSLCK